MHAILVITHQSVYFSTAPTAVTEATGARMHMFMMFRLTTRYEFVIVLECVLLHPVDVEDVEEPEKILSTIFGFESEDVLRFPPIDTTPVNEAETEEAEVEAVKCLRHLSNYSK